MRTQGMMRFDTGDDEVDRVEQRLATNLELERDPRVRVAVASGDYLVLSRTRDDVPRSAAHVVAEVHLLLTFVPVEINLSDTQHKVGQVKT